MQPPPLAADEMKKFAPDLKILMYYNLSQQKKKNFVTNLRDYDVVITTPCAARTRGTYAGVC